MGETYSGAGVDLDAADAAVEQIRPHVERTRRPEVLDSIGGFGGLYALDLQRWRNPVMVTGTDGVGTKLELARRVGLHRGVGIDLVAMVVDDIVVPGAAPQVFLDYIAIGKLDPDLVTEVVAGIADGCVMAGCALVGGEMAEHPGIMGDAEYDLAGFGVGLVERDRILGPHRVVAGDVLIAMASSGLHSNGYSLVRRLVDGLDLDADHGLGTGGGGGGGGGQTLGEALLTPTRIYTGICLDLADADLLHALCHVTGGGLPGNLPRVLPEGLGAIIDTPSWTPDPLFGFLQQRGQVSDEEMARVFNMGVGMVAVAAPGDVDDVLAATHAADEDTWVLGRVTDTPGITYR